jgi:methyl-accepting chemotaxis protein
MAFLVLAAIATSIIFGNRQLITAEKIDALSDLTSKDFPELTLNVKDIQINVIQVQQFLTDVSATRGLDGLDDGFAKAAENAKQFGVLIGATRALANRLKLDDVAQAVDQVAKAFVPYYERGQTMAHAYVAEGPSGGNTHMPAFDEGAEKLSASLQKLIVLADTVSKKGQTEIDQATGLAKDQLRTLSTILYSLGGVSLLIALGVFGYARTRISQPLQTLSGAMRELSEGKTDLTLPACDRADEIGAMGKAVQVFRENAIRVRSVDAEQLKETTERARLRRIEMAKLADDFQGAVGEIVNTVSTASTELEASAATLTASAQRSQQLGSMVASASEDASTNVRSMASATEEMASSVQEISRQVQESARIAHEAVDQAKSTNDRVGELSQAAGRIGAVVELINTIAGQTNLLALNATIEAARAGDAGRGFAVVASEVKALAEQTAKATGEISQQIDGIQAATQGSVAAIKEIGSTINRMSEIASTIASAVEQQGAATQEISRNVQRAALGTQQVSTNITDVQRGASETGSASSQVLSAAQTLSRDSNRLKLELDKFLDTVRAA